MYRMCLYAHRRVATRNFLVVCLVGICSPFSATTSPSQHHLGSPDRSKSSTSVQYMTATLHTWTLSNEAAAGTNFIFKMHTIT
jgi:hypothetical protein